MRKITRTLPCCSPHTGLLPPGNARGVQPHESPTAGNGNSMHIQLLLLRTLLTVFLTNPATTAPEHTAAHVHPASRAPPGNPTGCTLQPRHPAQHNSFWYVPQEVTQIAHGLIQSGGTLHPFCLRVFNASHPHTTQIGCWHSFKVTNISAKALLHAHALIQTMTGSPDLYTAAWVTH